MPVLWGHELGVRWRPSLRFFEEGVKFLRHLDDEGELQAFKVDRNLLEARLGPAEVLILRPNGADFHVIGPDSDPTRLQGVLHEALDRFQVQSLRPLHYRLQILDAVEAEATALCRSGGEMSAGRFLGPDSGVTDFSVLADGERDELTYQVEFGVLSSAEMPDRVLRSVGRIGHGDNDISTTRYVRHVVVFPATALFSDWSWFPANPLDIAGTPDELTGGLQDFCTSAMKSSIVMAGGIQNTMVAADRYIGGEKEQR